MLVNGYCAASAGGSAQSVPLCWWQGWSGHWYVTSVMPITRVACAAPGFFILVNRDRFGNHAPVTLGCSPNVERTLLQDCREGLARAVAAGAKEVHVNLLFERADQREAAVRDIARGWNAPLWQWEGLVSRA